MSEESDLCCRAGRLSMRRPVAMISTLRTYGFFSGRAVAGRSVSDFPTGESEEIRCRESVESNGIGNGRRLLVRHSGLSHGHDPFNYRWRFLRRPQGGILAESVVVATVRVSVYKLAAQPNRNPWPPLQEHRTQVIVEPAELPFLS